MPRPLAKIDRLELMQVLDIYVINKNNGKYPPKTRLCQICDAFCGLFRNCEVFPEDFLSVSGKNSFSFYDNIKSLQKKITHYEQNMLDL